MPIVIMHIAQN